MEDGVQDAPPGAGFAGACPWGRGSVPLSPSVGRGGSYSSLLNRVILNHILLSERGF